MQIVEIENDLLELLSRLKLGGVRDDVEEHVSGMEDLLYSTQKKLKQAVLGLDALGILDEGVSSTLSCSIESTRAELVRDFMLVLQDMLNSP